MIPAGLVTVIVAGFVLMIIGALVTYAVTTPAIYIPMVLIIIVAVGVFIATKVNKRSSNRV